MKNKEQLYDRNVWVHERNEWMHDRNVGSVKFWSEN